MRGSPLKEVDPRVEATLEDLDDILQGPFRAILQHALEEFDFVRQQDEAGAGGGDASGLGQHSGVEVGVVPVRSYELAPGQVSADSVEGAGRKLQRGGVHLQQLNWGREFAGTQVFLCSGQCAGIGIAAGGDPGGTAQQAFDQEGAGAAHEVEEAVIGPGRGHFDHDGGDGRVERALHIVDTPGPDREGAR